MKKQALILLALLIASAKAMAHSELGVCKLDSEVQSEEALRTQFQCIRAACIKQLTEEDTTGQSIAVEENAITKCVEDIYSELFQKDEERRKDEITRLRTNIKSTDDLNLLIDL